MLRHCDHIQVHGCYAKLHQRTASDSGSNILHWNATASTYVNSLNHLRVKLASDLDTGITVLPDVMVGSDDERTL